MRHTTTLCLTLLALLLLPACGSSGGGTTSSGPEVLTFAFTRVVATGDVTAAGTFTSHGANNDPGVGAGGELAAESNMDGTRGLLIFDGTDFRLLAESGTMRPDGALWSSTSENAVIDGGFTSFENSGSGGGLFIVPTDGSSSVTAIATSSTVVPDTAGMPLTGNPTFTEIGEHGRSGTLTVFEGVRNDGSDIKGLYMDKSGSLSLIFEEGDAQPLLGGTISFVAEPHARDGNWSVRVSTTTNNGIVASIGGSQVVVVDETDATPSGLGLFTGFDESSLSGSRVVFQGIGSTANGNGVYMYDHNTMTLSTIADETVEAPDAGQNFETASNPSIDGDYVVFESSAPVDGVYLRNLRDGTIYRVLVDGQVLDGKTVSVIDIRDAYTIRGNQIGLAVRFTDNSQALYTVQVNTQ